MDLLKKIRSATLIEALVATVLIVIIFVVSSLVLNNLLLNSFSANTHKVETRMSQLTYEANHKTIALPYSENFKSWRVHLEMQESGGKTWLKTKAENQDNGKEIIKNSLWITAN